MSQLIHLRSRITFPYRVSRVEYRVSSIVMSAPLPTAFDMASLYVKCIREKSHNWPLLQSHTTAESAANVESYVNHVDAFIRAPSNAGNGVFVDDAFNALTSACLLHFKVRDWLLTERVGLSHYLHTSVNEPNSMRAKLLCALSHPEVLNPSESDDILQTFYQLVTTEASDVQQIEYARIRVFQRSIAADVFYTFAPPTSELETLQSIFEIIMRPFGPVAPFLQDILDIHKSESEARAYANPTAELSAANAIVMELHTIARDITQTTISVLRDTPLLEQLYTLSGGASDKPSVSNDCVAAQCWPLLNAVYLYCISHYIHIPRSTTVLAKLQYLTLSSIVNGHTPVIPVGSSDANANQTTRRCLNMAISEMMRGINKANALRGEAPTFVLSLQSSTGQ